MLVPALVVTPMPPIAGSMTMEFLMSLANNTKPRIWNALQLTLA
jgi:hypothetical protein